MTVMNNICIYFLEIAVITENIINDFAFIAHVFYTSGYIRNIYVTIT